jgi:FkbM family methyltransferase
VNLFARILSALPWTAFRLIYVGVKTVRQMAGKDLRTDVRRSGLEWSLDLGETIDLWIYLTGSFQRASVEALGRLIEPGDLVFDIGANIGAHTLFMARAVGVAGQVYAFEPTDYAYGKLRKNLDRNPALRDRVRAEQMMLVDSQAGTAIRALHSSWPLQPPAEVHESHGGALMAASGARPLTVDAFCEERGIGRLNVVKLDVDGNECAVLRGARRTLEKYRPAIVLEVSPCVYADRAPDRFEDFVEILRALDYRLLNELTFAPLPADAKALCALVPRGGALNAIAIQVNA